MHPRRERHIVIYVWKTEKIEVEGMHLPHAFHFIFNIVCGIQWLFSIVSVSVAIDNTAALLHAKYLHNSNRYIALRDFFNHTSG